VLRVERLKVGNLPPLSFEVGDGCCLAIEGPSGSGKTRLLRAIADLDSAPGHVFLDGSERAELAAPLWRTSVRYVAAEPAWWTDTPRGAFPAGERAMIRADHLLSALALEPEVLDRPISMLSTGERQRLALARALIDEPRVLLLDEPTTGLDVRSAALVEELIKFQLLAGRVVLLSSHDRGLLQRISHERLILERPRPAAAESAVGTQGAEGTQGAPA
jgi:ABC-type multidrug transport system ATPase subunit